MTTIGRVLKCITNVAIHRQREKSGDRREKSAEPVDTNYAHSKSRPPLKITAFIILCISSLSSPASHSRPSPLPLYPAVSSSVFLVLSQLASSPRFFAGPIEVGENVADVEEKEGATGDARLDNFCRRLLLMVVGRNISGQI